MKQAIPFWQGLLIAIMAIPLLPILMPILLLTYAGKIVQAIARGGRR